MDQISWLILLLVITSLLLTTSWRLFKKPAKRPSYRSVAILVLGDIGRSPRMMYHAESFASHGFTTYVIGYKESKPLDSLLSNPRVKFLFLPRNIPVPGRLWIFMAPWKVLRQIRTILYCLLVRIPHPPQYILVQNPPSIPSLALVWLVSYLRGSKVIIDWHNLGYSILALRLGRKHVLVKLATIFEKWFGKSAYAHLFVTKAMKDFLLNEWQLKGQTIVLHDRPPERFRPASTLESHALFVRLTPALEASLADFAPEYTLPSSTPFTQVSSHHNPSPDGLADLHLSNSDGLPELRLDRPALLVTSTSWTDDEDFGLLLDALQKYEHRAKTQKGKLPKVIMFITGKGPNKAKYVQKMASIQKEQKWRFVRCVTLWLEARDYPTLLGSCDLGISLHSSSSALDLPMKVVDMFGCHLPVCALNFPCLHELVKDGQNGRVFTTADELVDQLAMLLREFPAAGALQSLRNNFVTPQNSHRASNETNWGTWQENWDHAIKPLVVEDHVGDAYLSKLVEEKKVNIVQDK